MFWLVGSFGLYLYKPLGYVSAIWGNGCLPERNYSMQNKQVVELLNSSS